MRDAGTLPDSESTQRIRRLIGLELGLLLLIPFLANLMARGIGR